MTPQTGTPFAHGRYLVWVETADGAGWLQPFITLWHDGAWRYRESTAKFDGKIFAWVGPLPALKVSDYQIEFLEPPNIPETYDFRKEVNGITGISRAAKMDFDL